MKIKYTAFVYWFPTTKSAECFLTAIVICSFLSNEKSQSFCPTISEVYNQWRIQDFPMEEGAPAPKVSVLAYYFAENCMKMKKNWSPRRPLRSATDHSMISFYDDI